MTLENALRDQLIALVDARCVDPLEILLEDADTADALRHRVRERAPAWARAMVAGDDVEATLAITRVIATLYPGDGPFDPPADWWRTPLGTITARRVGHPSAHALSYPVAGAMLGISRQGVHDLVNRGKLERHPDGGVTASSVRDRSRANALPQAPHHPGSGADRS
ncbi:hypothetical protein [Actinoalloteichus caeruleus]|uniref:hypothetical protein n=1 Tax=Actinoalloteichus cyanogriseus TaxID=2893586 RepID=UPI0004AB8D7E|nr:hypothetical protein [Actinoalloteichus caeruleus]